ncbi:hypothetical protein WN55_08813 [Dufourea novaeangliae]|uniref:Uncharacterized protein n=1 Tax=Dufourea novaeangliae TaxID=178035 RepID=A0A154NZV3_DUFNO|nr:hypothetical protein WN55_08813 [Dufourea novaeangliae]
MLVRQDELVNRSLRYSVFTYLQLITSGKSNLLSGTPNNTTTTILSNISLLVQPKTEKKSNKSHQKTYMTSDAKLS